jgi:hypothetical protein
MLPTLIKIFEDYVIAFLPLNCDIEAKNTEKGAAFTLKFYR